MSAIESPCTNICRIENGLCAGCRRTLDEIARWRDMPDSERHTILARLRGDVATHRCPDCGDPTWCALAAGEADTDCWCTALPEIDRARIRASEACLCRRCLAARVSSA